MTSPPRLVAALACLLLVVGLGVGATTGSASAASTLLCKGYAACHKMGMPNAGYAKNNSSMYWRMYSGHNCTNYVAYRLVRNGMANVRPWSGEGNASHWGLLNKAVTDNVPAVGSVAWWGANVRPAGSSGHVAYVEEVVSANEIIVSQDSWGGDFSWARITRAGGSWPSGFVHFRDAPLTNTVKPAVSGTAKVGARLTVSPGTWSPSDATIRYQWRANGVKIAKATGPTLTLDRAHEGKRIDVRTTASRLGYPKTRVWTAKTAPVEPGEITNTAPPSVTGTAQVDSTLTATPGTWKPAPATLKYQWSADGSAIRGATSATLTPDAELVDKTLSVTVTATKPGYDPVAATSSATERVAPGTFTVLEGPSVTGTPRHGETLTLQAARVTPEPAATAVQWLRGGRPIRGAVQTEYTLTPADLGYRIAARTTLTRPGYTTLTTKAPATRRVKSTAKIKVTRKPARGRVRLTVTVTAPAVRRVDGTVRVRSRGKLVAELTLRKGRRAVTVRDLPRGRRTFKIRYTGSRTVTPVSVTRSVRIR